MKDGDCRRQSCQVGWRRDVVVFGEKDHVDMTGRKDWEIFHVKIAKRLWIRNLKGRPRLRWRCASEITRCVFIHIIQISFLDWHDAKLTEGIYTMAKCTLKNLVPGKILWSCPKQGFVWYYTHVPILMYDAWGQIFHCIYIYWNNLTNMNMNW